MQPENHSSPASPGKRGSWGAFWSLDHSYCLRVSAFCLFIPLSGLAKTAWTRSRAGPFWASMSLPMVKPLPG
jgi:hypothetical protein